MIYYLVLTKQAVVVDSFTNEAEAKFYVKCRPYLRYEKFDIGDYDLDTEDDLPF